MVGVPGTAGLDDCDAGPQIAPRAGDGEPGEGGAVLEAAGRESFELGPGVPPFRREGAEIETAGVLPTAAMRERPKPRGGMPKEDWCMITCFLVREERRTTTTHPNPRLRHGDRRACRGEGLASESGGGLLNAPEAQTSLESRATRWRPRIANTTHRLQQGWDVYGSRRQIDGDQPWCTRPGKGSRLDHEVVARLMRRMLRRLTTRLNAVLSRCRRVRHMMNVHRRTSHCVVLRRQFLVEPLMNVQGRTGNRTEEQCEHRHDQRSQPYVPGRTHKVNNRARLTRPPPPYRHVRH